MASRTTKTYYWVIKGRHAAGKNFRLQTTAKNWMRSKIKKDKSVLGVNQLYYVLSPLKDRAIGYFGISGKWHEGGN
jgi:hypothetical protein